jgi:L-ornithine N5-oxygenase
VKQLLTDYHANTNYSVVDVNLIEELYRRHYQERVQGVERLRLLNASQLVDARGRTDGVEVTVHHLPSGGVSTLEADALVCATGYDATPPLSLMPDLAPLLLHDADGRLQVERDYRVATRPDVLGGIYLSGATEHSHGITSSLLSMAAVRAGEILASVAARAEAALHAPSVNGACDLTGAHGDPVAVRRRQVS